MDRAKLFTFPYFSVLYHSAQSLIHKTLNNSFKKQRNGAFIFIDFFDDLQITNHKPNLVHFFAIC